MKKRLVAAVGLVVLLAAVMVGSAAAQGGCFDDVVNFQACYVNGGLRIVHIGPDGKGYEVGTLPDTLFRYAAAVYENNHYAGRITSPHDGSFVDLYYGYKLASGSGFMEYWDFTIYNAGGTPLTTAHFQIAADADASVAPALSGGGQTASAGAAPAAVQVVPAGPVGSYEPNIIRGGTVNECLVRNTYAVRMRTAPSLSAPVLDRVPYDTSMPSDLRTVDDRWYRAFFVSEGGVGRLGWISADYLEVSDACADISAVSPLDQVIPVAPAAAPAAPAAASGGAAASSSQGEAPATAFDPTWGGRLDLTPVEGGSVNQCLVRNNYTVRIRLAPSNSAPVMDTVPYDSSMPADLRTTDGGWIRSNYLGSLGWISTQYLDASDACANLPGIAPIP